MKILPKNVIVITVLLLTIVAGLVALGIAADSFILGFLWGLGLVTFGVGCVAVVVVVRNAEPQPQTDNYYMSLGVAIGAGIGSALGVALSMLVDNPALIGIGISLGAGVGVAIGAALDRRSQRDSA